LAGASSGFWESRGHVAEGRRRLESALRAGDRPTAARAKALNGAAALAAAGGDVETARLRAEQGLALHRTLGDERGTATSLWMLGFALGDAGEWEGSRQLLEESVGLFRELGDPLATMWLTRSLAWTYFNLGKRERARTMYEDALRGARALRNRSAEAALLGALAMIATEDGRVEEAFSMLKESIPLSRDLGGALDLGANLCHVAEALAVAGRAEIATLLVSCSEVVFEEIGADVLWVARMNERTLAIIRSHLDEAAFADAWEQGRALTLDDACDLALEALD